MLNYLLKGDKIDAVNYETFSTPAKNIKDNLTNFALELAAPVCYKNDFSIVLEDDILKIFMDFELKKGGQY